jgi:YD repeat-containing protein
MNYRGLLDILALNMVLFFANEAVYAQTIPTVNVIPKTPEIQLVERYGNMPIDEYTGIPQISVPLHEISMKDNPFTIQLSYHAGGIRVNDEASWVGLGWNLSNFGSISVTAVGGADDYESAVLSDWDSVFNYRPVINGQPQMYRGVGRVRIHDNCGSAGDSEDPRAPKIPNENIVIESDKGNAERDIYNVNFLGQNFKFFIKPITGAIIMVGEKKAYKVSKEGNGWKVIDDKGYQYFFSQNEQYTYDGAPNQRINTWHLTQIVYQGRTLLKIVYDSYTILPLATVSDIYSFCYNVPGIPRDIYPPFGHDNLIRSIQNISFISAKYPKYLVTALDSVVFEKEARTDYRNAPALKYLKIFSRASGGLIKTIDFQKDYFVGSSIGADQSSLDYVTKRLRLNSLIITSNGAQKKYSFDYYGQLPYKTSFAQDFWGFYNGKENNAGRNIINGNVSQIHSSTRTLVPSASSLTFAEPIPETLFPFQAANRGVNQEFLTAGSLKSITYPTGGTTEFVYEPNQVNNVTYVDANQVLVSKQLKMVINNGNSSFSTPSLNFTLDREVKAKIKVVIKGTTFNITNFNAFSISLITNANTQSPTVRSYKISTNEQIQTYNNTKSVTIEEDLVIPPGLVVLNAFVGAMPDQGYTFNNGVVAELTYNEYKLDPSYTSWIGGLRIKETLNRDNAGSLATRKSFEYINEDNTTSGKLLQPLSFFKTLTLSGAIAGGTSNEGVISAIRQSYHYYQIYSQNTFSYEMSYSHANLGYSRVVVKDHNVQNNSYLPTYLNFYNVPLKNIATQHKFVPEGIVSHALNGKLLRRTVLTASLDTVLTEENEYAIRNVTYFPCNIHIFETYKGPNSGLCGLVNIARDNRYSVVVSAYSNFNLQLLSKNNSSFFSTEKVTEQEAYVYDATNYQVSEIQKALSNGQTEISRIKYANNLNTWDAALLTGSNIVSVPLERSTFVGNQLTDYYKVEYNTWNSVLAPANYYNMDRNLQLNKVLSISLYDAYGNPLELKKKEGPITTFLWGYDGQYPVAKIENATHAEVVTALGGTSAANIAFKNFNTIGVTDTYIRSTVQAIRSALSKALVAAYTYKPILGMSSLIDASGRTTYYNLDGFGRLKEVKDTQNKTTDTYEYHYRQ